MRSLASLAPLLPDLERGTFRCLKRLNLLEEDEVVVVVVVVAVEFDEVFVVVAVESRQKKFSVNK